MNSEDTIQLHYLAKTRIFYSINRRSEIKRLLLHYIHLTVSFPGLPG